MGYLETKAMGAGIYSDGRTWRHGSPQRYRKRSPSKRDKVMGYMEERAMEKGLIPVALYEDRRTWRHGQAAPYTKRRRSNGKR